MALVINPICDLGLDIGQRELVHIPDGSVITNNGIFDYATDTMRDLMRPSFFRHISYDDVRTCLVKAITANAYIGKPTQGEYEDCISILISCLPKGTDHEVVLPA